MAPFYLAIGEELGGFDQKLFDKMKQANDEKIKKLDDSIVDAKENFGESEVREALLAKADYYNRIGDKVIYLFQKSFKKC